jgi:hypothetical protein
MADRERKRAERRKRKQRSAERRASPTAEGDGAGAEADPLERMSAKAEERNRAAREALKPLREEERPPVVTIGAVISTLFAASIVIAYVAGAEVDDERPNVVGVIVPTLVIGVMAWGMWNARYWAVLGFQALLLIILIAATLGLLAAQTAVQAIGTALLIAVVGTLFWFMVKALARIQMPDRLPRD